MDPVRSIWYKSNLRLVFSGTAPHNENPLEMANNSRAITIITTMERRKTLCQVVQHSERFHIQPVVPASSDEMLSVPLLVITLDF
jgi:hypothetical protein